MHALSSVSSFLGVQHEDNLADQWQHRTEERAKQGLIGFVLAPRNSQISHDLAQDAADDEESLDIHASLSQVLESCQVDRIKINAFTKGAFNSPEVAGSSAHLLVADEDDSEEDKISEKSLDIEQDAEKQNIKFKSELKNPCYVDQSVMHLVTMDSTPPIDAAPSGIIDMLQHSTFSRMTILEGKPSKKEIQQNDPMRRVRSVKFTDQVDETINDSDHSHSSPQSSSFHENAPPSQDLRPTRSVLKNKNERSPFNDHYQSIKHIEPEKLVYRVEALEQYRRYIQLEKNMRLDNLRTRYESLCETLLRKQQKIDQLLKDAKDHYYGKHGVKDRSMRELIRSFRHKDPAKKNQGTSEMYVRRQIEEMPEYIPWITYLICMVQIISFCVICAIGGITTVSLEPQLKFKIGVTTLLGLETKEHWHIPNIWIGPSRSKIIGLGAVFAPCLRQDLVIQQKYREIYNMTDFSQLGCCEKPDGSVAGTTFEKECLELSGGFGIWLASIKCGDRLGTVNTPHSLWPCCYGFQGQCQLTTSDHCEFLEGIYHTGEAEHCSEVNCLASLCGLGGLLSDPTRPYSPLSADQGYRFLLAPMYHQGIIHLMLVVILQFIIGRPIEMVAGWLRMLVLYMIPAYVGILVGVLMDPYSPHTGGTGGLFGLLAIICVELVQSWKLVPKPWFEVAKLTGVAVLSFMAGTLPCVDNFTLVAGFICGILCGIIFLPYVTFGRSHMIVRRVLIGVALPVLIGLVLFLSYLFYIPQIISCDQCKYFSCIPYTATMCKVLELW